MHTLPTLFPNHDLVFRMHLVQREHSKQSSYNTPKNKKPTYLPVFFFTAFVADLDSCLGGGVASIRRKISSIVCAFSSSFFCFDSVFMYQIPIAYDDQATNKKSYQPYILATLAN